MILTSNDSRRSRPNGFDLIYRHFTLFLNSDIFSPMAGFLNT